MRLAALALVATLAGAGPGWAEPIGGKFSGAGAHPLFVEVMMLDGEPSYAARFTIGNPNDPTHCSGEFAAAGTLKSGRRFVFQGLNMDGQVCRVTMTFDNTFNQAFIEEQSCGAYHGPNCEFDGTVRRIAP